MFSAHHHTSNYTTSASDDPGSQGSQSLAKMLQIVAGEVRGGERSTTPTPLEISMAETSMSRIVEEEDEYHEEEEVDEEQQEQEREPQESSHHTFDQTKCLFCNTKNSNFNSNLSHMSKAHDFFIPDRDRLRVDLEMFCEYLDLVISGYAQCLYCGTERNNGHGARQHMLAKGHCRIDVTGEDSEYRDFYHDLSSTNTGDNTLFTRVDKHTIRLPSGKMLSSNRVVQRRYRRGDRKSPEVSNNDSSDSIEGPFNSGVMVAIAESSNTQSIVPRKASERRDIALANQLTRLRASNRESLAHLPLSQQRSQLSVQKKQIDEARRSQQFYEGRLKERGNKTLMKHFVPDTPGRTNG